MANHAATNPAIALWLQASEGNESVHGLPEGYRVKDVKRALKCLLVADVLSDQGRQEGMIS